RTWNRLKKKFVDHVTAEFMSNTNFICVTVHGQMIKDLIEVVRDSKEYDSRKEALLKLVELDMALFALLPTSDIIIQAELSQDLEFKAALSRVLDPKRKSGAFERQRQRHALFMLSCCGYKSKSYSKWSGFFKYFNAQLGEQSGIPRESAFTSFEQPDTVRAAIKEYGVPKDPERAGRRKTQANKS
ncbi:MAG: hypothetical protein NTW07_07395, partial [candidate division Zixibacteria bacterium]|nr:hypothetical protein [candidate division Zixibacteria bacterium]